MKFLGLILVILFAVGLTGCSKQQESPPSTNGTNSSSFQTKDYEFKGFGVLHLTFPKSWSDTTKRITVGQEKVMLFDFKPSDGGDFRATFQVHYLGEEKINFYDIKGSLNSSARSEVPNSIEGLVDIKQLKGSQLTGSYYTMTDRRWVDTLPPSGEYKHLTQGLATLGGMLFDFRILSNQLPAEESATALEMLRTATFTHQ